MFGDDLYILLEMTIDGTPYTIDGGTVKAFNIDLTSYGLDGYLEFWKKDDQAHGGGSEDLLLDAFTTDALIEVNFTVESGYNLKRAESEQDFDSPGEMVFRGLVSRKALYEQQTRKGDETAVMFRRYRVWFHDPMHLLWSQHRPIQLFAGKKLEDVLTAYRGQEIDLTYSWPVLATVHPILFMSMGAFEQGPSFYDFVIWLLHTQGGVLEYNPPLNAYTFSVTKTDVVGSLDRLDVARIDVLFPETPRNDVHVLNGYSEGPKNEKIDLKDGEGTKQAVAGVRRDCMVVTPITSQFNDRKTLETNRHTVPRHELLVELERWPSSVFLPGRTFELTGGEWSTDTFQAGKMYRLWRFQIEATAVDPSPEKDYGDPNAGFNIRFTARMELSEEARARLPEFEPPRWPVHVEGHIVSEQRAEDEETYQIYQHPDTSVDVYHVKIPLWEDQVVPVTFTPNLFPGHYYFPYYKQERVLVAFGFQDAKIVRFLDWRPGGRLPAETQGNHLLMGLKADSQTSMTHVYDGDEPQFKVLRTHVNDTSRIEITEGTFTIEVKEEEG